MVALTDIAKTNETVAVFGKDVDVYGVSAEGFAILLQRFPQLVSLAKGDKVVPADIIKMGPQVVGAVIAAGCGQPGNADAEAFAAKISVDTQLEFITKIGGATFPKGIGPFLERLQAMSGAVSDEVGKVRDTKSPKT